MKPPSPHTLSRSIAFASAFASGVRHRNCTLAGAKLQIRGLTPILAALRAAEGSVSKEDADRRAEAEYEEFAKGRRTLIEAEAQREPPREPQAAATVEALVALLKHGAVHVRLTGGEVYDLTLEPLFGDQRPAALFEGRELVLESTGPPDPRRVGPQGPPRRHSLPAPAGREPGLRPRAGPQG